MLDEEFDEIEFIDRPWSVLIYDPVDKKLVSTGIFQKSRGAAKASVEKGLDGLYDISKEDVVRHQGQDADVFTEYGEDLMAVVTHTPEDYL